MLDFFRRIFDPEDNNSLTKIEKSILENVYREHFPNIKIVSLRLQLMDWLSVKKLASPPGVPDWLQRKRSQGVSVLCPKRFIGGVFSLPKEIGKFSAAFSVVGQEVVEITVDQVVTRVVYPETLRSQDLEEILPARFLGELSDERVLWRRRAEEFEDYEALARRAETLIAEAIPRPEHGVVLPNPVGNELPSGIAGVKIVGEYARLLRFSDGIRINELLIWGSESSGQRGLKLSGRDWLIIGNDSERLYLLDATGGVAGGGEVFEIRGGGTPNGSGYDISGLVGEAFKGRIRD